MSKLQIYFLRNQGLLIMGYNNYFLLKKIFFIFLIILSSNKILNSNILYEKENIIITEVELKLYKEIHFKNNEEILSDSKAIKKIVIQKKVINRMLVKQPEFIKKIDNNILSQYGHNYLEDIVTRDYLRFIMLRNEFIFEYFNKDLKISDIRSVFSQFTDLRLPISKNDCLTIIDVIDIRDNDDFINNFYKNLKNNRKKYQVKIKDTLYEVCINQKKFSIIEKQLVSYIDLKIEENFNKFIYEK